MATIIAFIITAGIIGLVIAGSCMAVQAVGRHDAARLYDPYAEECTGMTRRERKIYIEMQEMEKAYKRRQSFIEANKPKYCTPLSTSPLPISGGKKRKIGSNR